MHYDARVAQLNPYLDHVLEQARATRDRAVREFGGLDGSALNWKPSPDRWSIAQCLHHLIVSNERYCPTFAAIADGSRRTTLAERIPILPRLWGPLVRRSMTPGNQVRVKTTADLQPSASDLSERVVEDFRTNVDEHLERIEALRHVDHRGEIVTSPFLGFVCYSLQDAIVISIVHLERHRLQAQRVMEHDGFPHGRGT